jgi:DNA-binding transcriptional LysR family regulator
MFDWDDLRHFLAVARFGTSQPTVVRHIAALEAAAGTALFERHRTGYTLTAAGCAVRPLAERVEAEVLALAHAFAAQSRRMTGTIRVTAPESIANVLLAPAVVDFRRSHPRVEVHILIEDRFLDIAGGEADLAIRATARALENSDLVGRVLSDAPWAAYCSRRYAEQAGRPADPTELARHAIIGGEGGVADYPSMRWLEAMAPRADVVWRSNSLTNLHAAVRAGLGVSVLPCLLGGSDAALVKCFPAGDPGSHKIWLLTRPDVRERPHVRALMDAVAAQFRAHRPLLMGEDGCDAP